MTPTKGLESNHMEGSSPLRSSASEENTNGTKASLSATDVNGLPSRPKPKKETRNAAGEQKRSPTSLESAKPAESSNDKKLTNAQFKALGKAEKTARRTAAKAAKEAQGKSSPQPNQAGESGGLTKVSSRDKAPGPKSAKGGRQHKRAPSTLASRPTIAKAIQGVASGEREIRSRKEQSSEERNRVAIFGHLYGQHKKRDILAANKDVHPAVLALGLQIKNYVICGGNARCAAMLLAFKRVIESYSTPPGHALSRHLTIHLSIQITHLTRHSRPLCTGQASAIRHLKLILSRIDPSLPETTAKSHLLSSIDTFIREKITLADEVIARTAAEKIVDGDVILVYGKSSIVEKTLLEAYETGKKFFRVLVVDSRPLFEGRNLAQCLSERGIPTTYLQYTALDQAAKEASKVFLGASSMMSNGRLYSRVGTAGVAMMAKEAASGERGRPVIVLCETVKFSGGSMLDGVVSNEIGSENMLLEGGGSQVDMISGKSKNRSAKEETASTSLGKKPSKQKGKDLEEDPEEIQEGKPSLLSGWTDQSGLQLLNIMYDVTPAEYVDMVITELGCLPPSSVPVVIGLDEGRGG